MSVAKYVLLPKTLLTDTAVCRSQAISAKDHNFIGFVKCEDLVDGTFTCKIKHSPNNVDFFDLCAFTALTANGFELKAAAVQTVFPHVIAECVVTGSSESANITIELYHD